MSSQGLKLELSLQPQNIALKQLLKGFDNANYKEIQPKIRKIQ